MSAFDKLVANWVSEASTNVSTTEKEKMLTSINRNLTTYRKLEDPKAAQAHEAKAAEEEENRRRAEEAERRQMLPPLSPTKNSTATAPKDNDRKKKKGTASKTSSKQGKRAASSTKADEKGGAKQPAAAAEASAEGPKTPVFRVKVQEVDYSFEDEVHVALRDLKKSGQRSSTLSTATQAPPPARKASAKPPMLVAVQADAEDADNLREDIAFEHEAMQSYTFGGHSSPLVENPNSDDDRFDRTVAGKADDIDDQEDSRRRRQQMKRPSRLGISDASVDIEQAKIMTFPPTPKSRDKVKVITKTLESHFLFSFLDDGDIARFASIMDMETFEEGKEVIVKGELNDTLFLVLSGEAEATVENADGTTAMVTFVKGMTIGDIGLMYATRNEITVTARTDLQCASLERHTYKMITSRAMEERRERYAEFIRTVPLLSSLSEFERSSLTEVLKESTYMDGQPIIEAGKPSMWMHFIVEGEVDVVGQRGERVATLSKGGYVGHLEFINHIVAVADVMAASLIVKTAKLSRRQFERLLAPVIGTLTQEVEESEQYEYYRNSLRGHSPPIRDASPCFDEPPTYLQDTLRNQQELQDALTELKNDNGDGDDDDNGAFNEEL